MTRILAMLGEPRSFAIVSVLLVATILVVLTGTCVVVLRDWRRP